VEASRDGGRVKRFKAGFVASDSNVRPDHTLRDVLACGPHGHTTMASPTTVAHRAPPGHLTSRDYRLSTTPPDAQVKDLMTPFAISSTAGGHGPVRGDDLIWSTS